MKKKKRILLVENFEEDFYKSRLRYAKFLNKQGSYEVYTIVSSPILALNLIENGIKTIKVKHNPRSRRLLDILKYFFCLYIIFKKQKFDVYHFYRLQPNILGSLVARITSPSAQIINHVTGLGIVFSRNDLKSLLLQKFIRFLYIFNSKVLKTKIIVQNKEDVRDLQLSDKCFLVEGSTVNEEIFKPLKEKSKLKESQLTLLFASRLIKEKGLEELIQAIEIFNRKEEKRPKVFLKIAGWRDSENPNSISKNKLDEWLRFPYIEFLGKVDQINVLISQIDVAILPTYYREGVPRFLLEAMACGKPIITSKTPGCSDLIKNNSNGLLVTPRDVNSIVESLTEISDLDLEVLGKNSLEIYHRYYSESRIFPQILKVYSA